MTDRVTEADLARWEAMAAQATPGPWYATTETCDEQELDDYVWTVGPEASSGNWDTDHGWPGYGILKADADFIASSRIAVPALVDEVRRLRQVLEIAALACEDHGARALARAIREAEREHVLRPEEGSGDA